MAVTESNEKSVEVTSGLGCYEERKHQLRDVIVELRKSDEAEGQGGTRFIVLTKTITAVM